MNILSAIVLLGILIFVHELGHFLAAKLMGVKVLKFSLGFGKKLIGRKYGETEYQIAAFPLGGYVKMLGEESGEEMHLTGDKEEEPAPEEDLTRAFSAKPVWKRFLIVLAGPAFNIFFAAIIFAAIFMQGVPVLLPEVGEVMKDTPAQAAGLLEGDRIAEIDGVEIEAWGEMTGIIHQRPEKELHFKIARGDSTFNVSITPEKRMVENIFGEETEVGLIGIKPSGAVFYESHPPHRSLMLGIQRTVDITSLTLVAIVKLVQGNIPAETIGGPIMIVQMAGERASEGLMHFFMFMAVISINLGIVNLLPIPILDGGHLLFLGYETAFRKPPGEKAIAIAQKLGLVLILTLMAFAFYNDILRIITGKSLP